MMMGLRRRLPLAAVFALGVAGCGTKPCGESSGPTVRLDVALGTCNSAPLPDISGPRSVGKNAMVELDASTSTDLNGDPLTFSWSFMDKPEGSAAELSVPGSAKASFLADVVGAYEVVVEVSDGAQSASTSIIISSSNTKPIAAAGGDFALEPGSTAQLDASASRDDDGDPLFYTWTLDSKPSLSTAALSDASSVSPNFVVDIVGDYVVRVSVSDGESVAEDSITVMGAYPGAPPIANAGSDQSVMVNDLVMLDGRRSIDPDGDTLRFQWVMVAQPAGSNVTLAQTMTGTTSFVADVRGVYSVQLEVRDPYYTTVDQVDVYCEVAPPPMDGGPDDGGVVTIDYPGSGGFDSNKIYIGSNFGGSISAGVAYFAVGESRNTATGVRPVRTRVLKVLFDGRAIYDIDGMMFALVPEPFREIRASINGEYIPRRLIPDEQNSMQNDVMIPEPPNCPLGANEFLVQDPRSFELFRACPLVVGQSSVEWKDLAGTPVAGCGSGERVFEEPVIDRDGFWLCSLLDQSLGISLQIRSSTTAMGRQVMLNGQALAPLPFRSVRIRADGGFLYSGSVGGPLFAIDSTTATAQQIGQYGLGPFNVNTADQARMDPEGNLYMDYYDLPPVDEFQVLKFLPDGSPPTVVFRREAGARRVMVSLAAGLTGL